MIHAVRFSLVLLALGVVPCAAVAQTVGEMRVDQINRLQDYVLDAILPNGLVRDSLVLNPAANSFHPATPDAAGFALLSLAAFDHLNTLPNADQHVVDILNAYTGNTAGVTPERSPDGHYIHFMDINDGSDPPGWDDSYSPIGSALIVAGAQFARNHFADAGSPLASQIDSLTTELTDSIDFNAAIHPSLDGRVYLDMTPQGGGAGGAVVPWNEYQLVVSLALRQEDNDRAIATKHLWLNPDNAPQRSLAGLDTLTDNVNRSAPAFWVQQAQFFNGDFRHNEDFQTFLANAQEVDRRYSSSILGEEYRYGLTAGVSPSGYHADRVQDHPDEVFSPEAVAAWGDMTALLEFYKDQPPASDPRYRYGMVRVSDEQPGWIPGDAGLVDHLFLLYGLVESIAPDFFADRVFDTLVEGDYNYDGVVDAADYTVWRDTQGLSSDLSADGDLDGDVDPDDYTLWQTAFAATSFAAAVPEPGGLLAASLALFLAASRNRRAA